MDLSCYLSYVNKQAGIIHIGRSLQPMQRQQQVQRSPTTLNTQSQTLCELLQ